VIDIAYVFGIDIPINELLLIVLVMVLIGLIFILLELRKLTRLIVKETTDIDRFELDLAKFEHFQGQKPSEDMIAHIQEAKAKGYSDTEIQNSLSRVGWNKQSIDQLYKRLSPK